jgi:diaminohydroxyphosphoribosylaminopyrimidine deaminase/5-amino-6-(5-phosphoribosylamino)uracil reductase
LRLSKQDMHAANEHQLLMKRCLELAANGLGKTLSNPMVGCIIVHESNIIGEGFHAAYGKAHAEIHALEDVKEKHLLKDATMYVSLEPCNHTGKTPPCTEALLASGISKVVVAQRDPHPLVSGKGIAFLRSAGIEVTEGVMEEEAAFLNRRFICFHKQKRPYIILKWAQSENGIISGSNGQTLAITGEESRVLVHKWRSEEMGILVGCHTILNDNPQLTVRAWSGHQPLRIAIDPNGRIPSDHSFFSNSASPFLLVSEKWRDGIGAKGAQLLTSSEKVLPMLMEHLYRNNILSVMVEGGSKTIRQFVDAGLWDEARIGIRENLFLQDGTAAPEIHGVHFHQETTADGKWFFLKPLREAASHVF